MGALVGALKYVLNGAKLPNWLKLVLGLAVLALIYVGQGVAVKSLTDVQREVSAMQIREMRRTLVLLRSDILDTREDIQDVADRDSVRARRDAARFERLLRNTNEKLEEIDENGTHGGNAKIDELYKLVRRRS